MSKVQVLKELGLQAGGTASTLLKLSSDTEQLKKNIEVSNEAYKEGIATQKEYAVASGSLAQQQERAESSILLMQKAIGEILKPACWTTTSCSFDHLISDDL